MAKRIAIIAGLLLVALVTGLLGAQMLGGPFISRDPVNSAPATQRYALGRDIYNQDEYAVDTRYMPYEPGGKRIASPTVSGARAIEPYEAARPDHRLTFHDNDGNFLEGEDLPRSDYAMIDPPVRKTPKAEPTKQIAEEPENLLPRGFIRSERPAYPAAAKPAEKDPVAETEQRINAMTGARDTGASPQSAGTTDGRPSEQ